ncbi:MAG: hypothetical protein B7Z16_03445, partial [Algoriphagus sp. 32-45-6]
MRTYRAVWGLEGYAAGMQRLLRVWPWCIPAKVGWVPPRCKGDGRVSTVTPCLLQLALELNILPVVGTPCGDGGTLPDTLWFTLIPLRWSAEEEAQAEERVL